MKTVKTSGKKNQKFLNFEKIQAKWIKRSVKLKKRVNKMKKFNKKFFNLERCITCQTSSKTSKDGIQKPNSMKIYWCSTKLQLADYPSRKVDWNEEFIPGPRFIQLCNQFKFFPDVDMMAKAQNAKAKQYIMWGKPYNEKSGLTECIGTDFLP